MKMQIVLEFTLSDPPEDRKLSKAEKEIVKNSILNRFKTKDEPCNINDEWDGWRFPLVPDHSLMASFDIFRHLTKAETLEVELKARELFPDKFN